MKPGRCSLARLPALRGSADGVIVRPSLATAMIRFPEFLLRGTLRGQGGAAMYTSKGMVWEL